VLIFLQAYHVYPESAKSFMPTDDDCRGIFLTKEETSFGGGANGTLCLIILFLEVGSRGLSVSAFQRAKSSWRRSDDTC